MNGLKCPTEGLREGQVMHLPGNHSGYCSHAATSEAPGDLLTGVSHRSTDHPSFPGRESQLTLQQRH